MAFNFSVDAIKPYEHTQKLTSKILNYDDRNMAIRGLVFTQPDFLPEGFNQASNGNYDGILNLIDRYKTNPETGELEAPVRTFMMVG